MSEGATASGLGRLYTVPIGATIQVENENHHSELIRHWGPGSLSCGRSQPEGAREKVSLHRRAHVSVKPLHSLSLQASNSTHTLALRRISESRVTAAAT
jgi:hypothetical protein